MPLVVMLVTGKEEEGSDCGKRRFHVLRTALPLGCIRASLVHGEFETDGDGTFSYHCLSTEVSGSDS